MGGEWQPQRDNRLKLWPQCWRTDLTDAERFALWDQLRLHEPHEASISWEEIAEVVAFLRSQGVKDGEVIAWFDSPHAAYLVMDTDPGIRYMHVYTAMTISALGAPPNVGAPQVMKELAEAKKAKFVINDLEWAVLWVADDSQKRAAVLGPARNPPHDLLPAAASTDMFPLKSFPYNQPTVFRTRNGTGRYLVHLIVTREDGPPVVASEK